MELRLANSAANLTHLNITDVHSCNCLPGCSELSYTFTKTSSHFSPTYKPDGISNELEINYYRSVFKTFCLEALVTRCHYRLHEFKFTGKMKQWFIFSSLRHCFPVDIKVNSLDSQTS